VAKREKKQQGSFAKIPRLGRRSWLVVGLIVLALCLILGTSVFIKRTTREVLRGRLPQIPELTLKNEALRQKMADADQVVKKLLHAGRPDEQFGERTGELGKLYHANHYYDQAVIAYRLAMEFESENPHWSYLLASVHHQRGENESARALLKCTIVLAPNYSPAMLKLADNYFKTGKTEKAKAYYGHRLSLSPGDPYALLGLARIALDRSEWEIAEAHLEKAIESDPKFGDAHRMLASVHGHFDRNEEMKQALDQAARSLRFHPASDPWIDALEDLCYDTEQLLVLGAKAIAALDMEAALNKFYRRAMKLDPENPKVHLAMGKAFFMVGQRKQAREFFKKTIELNSKSDEAYFQLGLILRTERRFKEAEKMLLKALNFQPNNPNVYNNLGVTLLEQGKFREAIEYLKQAIEIYPEHINARYNLGMSLWGSGKTEEAIAQYNQVLKLKPAWPTAANSLAWILATNKNEDIRNGNEAVRWALVASRGEGRKNPEYLDTLAAAYARAGLFKEAIRTARECLNLALGVGDQDLSQAVEHRLQLYKSGKAFHN